MSNMSNLLLLLFFVFLPHPSTASVAPVGFRIPLTHVDSTGNYNLTELLRRAVQRSARRAQFLQKATARSPNVVEAPIYASDLEYLMNLTIGTPPLVISAIADTGSDLIWTQCVPCHRCFAQPTPLYNSSASSTFRQLPCTDPACPRRLNSTACSGSCGYSARYGDNSTTSGVLAVEVFTFGLSDQGSNATLDFGCGTTNDGDFANSTGIVGLGRGPLSLVSQLHSGRFSYCLASLTEVNASSTFLLGSLAQLNGSSGGVQSTPIIQNPAQSSFYYLPLTGISLGSKLLPIPNNTFGIKPDGEGGLVIDSGSSFTSLEQSGYAVLRKEIVSLVSLPVSGVAGLIFDLCFSLPNATAGSQPPEMPDLTFHFDAGANMTFSRDKYMIWDPTAGLFCLTISGQNDSLSVLGNFQQQDLHLLFDLDAGMLSFVPAQCNKL